MIVYDYHTSKTKMSIRLGVISQNVSDELLKTISEIVRELQAYVIREKLSGQLLQRRSGRLIRGIKRRVFTGKKGVFGIVMPTAPHSLAHEFGMKRTQPVKAGFRTLRSGLKANVRAHSRKIDYPKRAYMRPSFKELRDSIQERLEEAVARGVTQE